MNDIIKLLLLCGTFHLIYTQSYQCDTFRCSQFNLGSSQCVYAHPFSTNTTNSSFIYDISLTCQPGYYCPPSFTGQNSSCTLGTNNLNRVDGQSCTNNTDCASNVCNNNICQGIAALGVCTLNTQCKVGAYCGKLTNNSLVTNCLAQKGLNQSCASNLECNNNLGCYSGNNTCQTYFSLPDGTPAGKGHAMMCQNMKVYNGSCVSTQLLSGAECLANNGTLQTKCQFSTSSNVTFDTNCQCSKAYPNRQFCEYDTQNPNWQKLISAMDEYFEHDAINKHTTQRMLMGYDLQRLYLSVASYPQYKDADDCAINIELEGSFTKSPFFSFALVLIFALFA